MINGISEPYTYPDLPLKLAAPDLSVERCTLDAVPDPLPEALRELVARQCGVVTGRQLAEAGITRHAAKSKVTYGRWQRVHPGVYATFSGQPDRLALLWAAVLSAGPGAMLSYQTAAELARLTDRPGDLIHVTIPADRRVTKRPGIVVHRSDRTAEAMHPVKLPPQTRVEETVLDLVGAARTLDDAAGWVLRAIQRGLTARGYLARALAQRPRICWRAELTELLTLDADGLHSVLEHRYYRDVERPHALPAGTRQARVRRGGRTEYRDILYELYCTAVELDGDAAHPADSRWRDIRRDNAAAADGITTLRYSWLDVTARPCQVGAEVARVLARYGYAGARPCSPGCSVGQAQPGRGSRAPARISPTGRTSRAKARLRPRTGPTTCGSARPAPAQRERSSAG
jgi:hypothetical protein